MPEIITNVEDLFCKYYDEPDEWSCDIVRTYQTLEGDKKEASNRRVNNIMFHKNVIQDIGSVALGFIE